MLSKGEVIATPRKHITKGIAYTLINPQNDIQHQRLLQIPNEIIIPKVAELVSQGHTVTLPLRGWSMRPYLENDRDKALLCAPHDRLHVGDVILARIADRRYALHRIVKIDGNSITMCGDGNLSAEHIRREDVMALAIGFYRKGRTTIDSVDTWQYKAYWRLWVALRPIRRWLLLMWRLKTYPRETVGKIMKRLGR